MKYQVLERLWSPSLNRYIDPGEVMEFDQEIALKLLNKRVIQVAEYKPTQPIQKHEVKHDTNNQSSMGRGRKGRDFHGREFVD